MQVHPQAHVQKEMSCWSVATPSFLVQVRAQELRDQPQSKVAERPLRWNGQRRLLQMVGVELERVQLHQSQILR